MVQKPVVKRNKPLYITVMGTMGSGKTTVAKLISERLRMRLVEENFGDNAFLPRFYQDMKRWAFHSQTFFLMEKTQQLLAIGRMLGQTVHSRGIVQDTPIEQDVFSYAKAQCVLGNMDRAQWLLYKKIYDSMRTYFPTPDLIIFLDTSIGEIVKRIEGRGRGFEAKIPVRYIQLLDRLTREWIKKNPDMRILPIQTDGLDIVRNGTSRKKFLEIVSSYLKQKKLTD